MGPSIPVSPTGDKCLVRKAVFTQALGKKDPCLPPWGKAVITRCYVCIPLSSAKQLWETCSTAEDAYPCSLSVLSVLLALGAQLDQECLERKTQQMFRVLVCVPWMNNMQISGTWNLEGFSSWAKGFIICKLGTWTGMSLEEHNKYKNTRKSGQVLM